MKVKVELTDQSGSEGENKNSINDREKSLDKTYPRTSSVHSKSSFEWKSRVKLCYAPNSPTSLFQ